MDKYFGPLPREYCVYFYLLSIIFGTLFVFSAISIAFFMIMHFKKVNITFIINSNHKTQIKLQDMRLNSY